MSTKSKLDLLLELDNYKRKGYRSYNNLDISSSRDEIYFELELAKSQERENKKEKLIEQMGQMEQMLSMINSGFRERFDFDMGETLLEELGKIATQNGYSYTKDEMKDLMKEFVKIKFGLK
jgi:hypothetical protein